MQKFPLLCYAMNYPKIKLHKNHIALNPKVSINNQLDYDYNINLLLYLHNQLNLGVEPKWLVTFHYFHPTELAKPLRETAKPFGFGDRYSFKTYTDIWKQVPFYRYLEQRRNDIDSIYEDTSQIKNSILKCLYGIKRLNRVDRYEFPNLFFFHEKGKVKLQYHTHLLLTGKNLKYDDKTELNDVFNTTIRTSRKCFSKWKKIDIEPVKDKYGLMGYLNKETNANHISLDPYNSVPILLK
jgi:hypothetical protein